MEVYGGVCICKREPKGNKGLEGYIEREQYEYELVDSKYYRIYFSDDYFEVCSINTFHQYFRPL